MRSIVGAEVEKSNSCPTCRFDDLPSERKHLEDVWGLRQMCFLYHVFPTILIQQPNVLWRVNFSSAMQTTLLTWQNQLWQRVQPSPSVFSSLGLHSLRVLWGILLQIRCKRVPSSRNPEP